MLRSFEKSYLIPSPEEGGICDGNFTRDASFAWDSEAPLLSVYQHDALAPFESPSVLSEFFGDKLE